jgi:DNA-binding transcriptional regulator YiaG
MVAKNKPFSATQQELLRDAMDELGMTRAEFATRLSVAVRTLDKWLMPEMGKAYVREIVGWYRKSV